MRLQLKFFSKILLLLFLCSCFISCNKKLGMYCGQTVFDETSYKFHNNFCIELKKKKRFDYYKANGWPEIITGSGEFSFRKDTLVLDFDDLTNTRGKLKIGKIGESDNVELSISVVDSLTHDPVVFATVVIIENGTAVEGFETDFDGNVKLELPISKASTAIEILAVGKIPLRLKLDESGKYEITAEVFSSGVMGLYKQEKFRIGTWSENYMRIIGRNDRVQMELFRYDTEKKQLLRF